MLTSDIGPWSNTRIGAPQCPSDARPLARVFVWLKWQRYVGEQPLSSAAATESSSIRSSAVTPRCGRVGGPAQRLTVRVIAPNPGHVVDLQC